MRTFLLQQAIRKSKMTAGKLAARSKSSKHRYRDAVPATASAAADKSAPTLPPVGSAATAAEHAAGGKHSGVAANAEATTDSDDEDEDRGSDGDGGRASGDDSDVEAVCSSTGDGALKPPPSEAVQNGAAARIAEEITTIKVRARPHFQVPPIFVSSRVVFPLLVVNARHVLLWSRLCASKIRDCSPFCVRRTCLELFVTLQWVTRMPLTRTTKGMAHDRKGYGQLRIPCFVAALP